jgi:hypothetical protein
MPIVPDGHVSSVLVTRTNILPIRIAKAGIINPSKKTATSCFQFLSISIPPDFYFSRMLRGKIG